MQDSTHAVGVPVVALTADERGALRNHIALTLLLAGGDLEDAYCAVELARPGAVDRVSKALVDIRFASDALERDFGWDPTADAFLQLDEAGKELLHRAVAQARGCLPPNEQDHPDDVRGWVALIALGDRVGAVPADPPSGGPEPRVLLGGHQDQDLERVVGATSTPMRSVASDGSSPNASAIPPPRLR